MLPQRYSTSVDAMRWFVIGVNILSAIAGIGLIGLGIYSWTQINVTLASSATPITLIITGILVFIVSCFGLFGAISESRKILKIYFAILAILVVAQLAITITAFTSRHGVENTLNSAWQLAYEKHPRIIRDIEQEFSCCGFKNVTDRAIPKKQFDSCITNPYFGFETPCFEELKEAYIEKENFIGGVGTILALIQISSLIFTFILINHLPTDRELEEELLAEHRRLVNQGRHPGDNQHQHPFGYGSTSGESHVPLPQPKQTGPLHP